MPDIDENWTNDPPTKAGLYWYSYQLNGRWTKTARIHFNELETLVRSEIRSIHPIPEPPPLPSGKKE